MDKLTENYEKDQLVLKIEQLQAQLDFINQENEKFESEVKNMRAANYRQQNEELKMAEQKNQELQSRVNVLVHLGQ